MEAMGVRTGKIRQLVLQIGHPDPNPKAIEDFITLVKEGDIPQLVMGPFLEPCSTLSRVAATILESDESTPAVIDMILEAYLNARTLPSVEHSYWVDHLWGFSALLWKRRLTAWINKLYTPALQYKTEDEDHHGYYLLRHFAELSRWDDRPEDFGITPENLGWMDWTDHEHTKERIDHSPFPSEAAHIIWELRHPEYLRVYSNRASWPLVSVNKVNGSIARLKELGVDTAEFDGLLVTLLNAQLRDIQEEMGVSTERLQTYLRRGIDITRAELASLG
jgi:hypothetical protein